MKRGRMKRWRAWGLGVSRLGGGATRRAAPTICTRAALEGRRTAAVIGYRTEPECTHTYRPATDRSQYGVWSAQGRLPARPPARPPPRHRRGGAPWNAGRLAARGGPSNTESCPWTRNTLPQVPAACPRSPLHVLGPHRWSREGRPPLVRGRGDHRMSEVTTAWSRSPLPAGGHPRLVEVTTTWSR